MDKKMLKFLISSVIWLRQEYTAKEWRLHSNKHINKLERVHTVVTNIIQSLREPTKTKKASSTERLEWEKIRSQYSSSWMASNGCTEKFYWWKWKILGRYESMNINWGKMSAGCLGALTNSLIPKIVPMTGQRHQRIKNRAGRYLVWRQDKMSFIQEQWIYN